MAQFPFHRKAYYLLSLQHWNQFNDNGQSLVKNCLVFSKTIKHNAYARQVLEAQGWMPGLTLIPGTGAWKGSMIS